MSLINHGKAPRDKISLQHKDVVAMQSGHVRTQVDQRPSTTLPPRKRDSADLQLFEDKNRIIADCISGKRKRLEQATIKTERRIVCLNKILKRAKT